MQINIFYKTKIPPYYHKTGIYKKALLKANSKKAKEQKELNVFVVSPKEMLKINTEFLGHKYITDVITFPYPQTNLKGEVFGDIIVCFEQAKEHLENTTDITTNMGYVGNGKNRILDDIKKEQEKQREK